LQHSFCKNQPARHQGHAGCSADSAAVQINQVSAAFVSVEDSISSISFSDLPL
jgi:hypothetical protein